MKADAIITVRFFTSAEGGRKTSITGSKYGCPLIINNQGYDCRFALDDISIELGNEYTIPIAFLVPEEALKKLRIDSKISLWEGKVIAIGSVIEIINRDENKDVSRPDFH